MRYISFSGGVESTAMCMLYGKGATAIFSDTGSEHKFLYDRIDIVERAMKEYHDGDFNMVRVTANVKVGEKTVNSLTDYILESNFFPTPKERFCTRLFKVSVIDNFLKDKGDCELLIGLNADETDRVGNLELCKNVNYRYPLIEDGIDRDKCIELISSMGLEPKFPAYMRRGGCIFCPFKSKKEYRAMVHLSPDEINLVASIEESIQDKRNKYFRIKSDMPKVRDFINIEQNTLFGEDMSKFYDDSDEQYSCGVWCHR